MSEHAIVAAGLRERFGGVAALDVTGLGLPREGFPACLARRRGQTAVRVRARCSATAAGRADVPGPAAAVPPRRSGAGSGLRALRQRG